LHKLLKQFSRQGLPPSTDPNAKEYLESLADRFENLPLYFMKFHGGSDIDEVLDAMEYAVYVNDVEHIVLVGARPKCAMLTTRNATFSNVSLCMSSPAG
jgi:twinkle protein